MPLWTPIREAGSIVSEGREVWVKIRASKAERAEWHTKARSVGLSLSDLVRRSVGPGADLDGRARRAGTGAHPRAGAGRGSQPGSDDAEAENVEHNGARIAA